MAQTRGPECKSKVGQHCKCVVTWEEAQGSPRDPQRQGPSWQKPELRNVWAEVGVKVLALTQKLNKPETASKGKGDAGWE